MIARRTVSAQFAFALLLGVGATFPAFGQGHTPDPYNIVGEYNRQYEPFMYASEPDTPGTLPNQDRADLRSGLRNANRFQSFLNEEEDGEGIARGGLSRNSGPGVPYYRANRQFDHEFRREYRPNYLADRTFYSDLQLRNEKYFDAMKEPDPRKRAQLMREYNAANLKATRDLSPNRNAAERGRPGLNAGAMNGAEDEDLVRPEPRSRGADVTPPAATPTPTPARGLAAPRATPNASRTAPRAGGLTAPPPPASARNLAPAPPRSRTAPLASDVLERSELLDRASRAVAPIAPRATTPVAPPPPPR